VGHLNIAASREKPAPGRRGVAEVKLDLTMIHKDHFGVWKD
jgi:hypothetical protein